MKRPFFENNKNFWEDGKYVSEIEYEKQKS